MTQYDDGLQYVRKYVRVSTYVVIITRSLLIDLIFQLSHNFNKLKNISHHGKQVDACCDGCSTTMGLLSFWGATRLLLNYIESREASQLKL